jgi:hypothetical protein
MKKIVYLIWGMLLVMAIWTGACGSPEITPGDPEDFVFAQGEFRYYVRGAQACDKQGRASFFRAGTHVVVHFGPRTDSVRLELAYEETRENHEGEFQVKQIDEVGGFLLYFKNGEENYWQQSGTIAITHSSEDSIVGRIDEVILATPSGDTLKEVELTGHFMAL